MNLKVWNMNSSKQQVFLVDQFKLFVSIFVRLRERLCNVLIFVDSFLLVSLYVACYSIIFVISS